MLVDVETLTLEEQQLLGHLIVLTNRVPPAQSPRFVYYARSRSFGLLRHPVLSNLQAPVENDTLVGLHQKGLVTFIAEADGTSSAALTALGLEMCEPLRAVLRGQVRVVV